jgi:hypothetical protein
MKTFEPFRLLRGHARREVAELRLRLASRSPLAERADILPFFRQRPHLAALCGRHSLPLLRCDRLAWECALFGEFACDLAVGDSSTKSCTFIEFEGAGPASLFVRPGRRTGIALQCRVCVRRAMQPMKGRCFPSCPRGVARNARNEIRRRPESLS